MTERPRAWSRRAWMESVGAGLAGAALALPAAGRETPGRDARQPRRVVIDADTANEIDDQYAIVRALIAPELRVEAITAAGFTDRKRGVERSYDESRRILDLMGLGGKIPLAMGSNATMKDRRTPVVSDAAKLIVERAMATGSDDGDGDGDGDGDPEPLYVLALGQFTNLASALLMEPRIADRVVFTCIDGDYRHGKSPAWGRGIYNWRNDVAAVQAIFESRVPYIHMPARSVSGKMYVERETVARMLDGKGPVCDFLVSLWDRRRFRDRRGKILWDISLVHVMIDPDHGMPVTVGAPLVRDDGTTEDRPDNPRRVTVYADIDPAAIFESYWKAVDAAEWIRGVARSTPRLTRPVLFDTPEADRVLESLQVFPPDNPWNKDVSSWPLHPNSKRIIESIGIAKPLRYNPDMAFVLVPPGTKRVPVRITAYPDESDKGPFPMPANLPIEGWPAHFKRSSELRDLTLEDVQRDTRGLGGDRHAIVVDPESRTLYELYQARLTEAGWTAAQASIFDLKSNALRPDGWTSADAAGLPIFPAIVRHDEIARGVIRHAMRVTVRRTRRAYVAPATHFASRLADPNLPRMGERIRLRADFDTSRFSPAVKTILEGLKKYGMFVADNGIDWAISVAPDERIPIIHEELRGIRGADFEVVVKP